MKRRSVLILTLVSCFAIFSRSVHSEDSQNIEDHQLKFIQQASDFDLVESFRSPKKILFSCFYGGSSHNHWVISILNELSQRGHNTTYVTKDDHVKFASNYPNIKTISIGKTTIEDKKKVFEKFRTDSSIDDKAWAVSNVESAKTMEQDTIKLLALIQEEKYDLLICDLFNNPCTLAAYKLNLPAVLTSDQPVTNDVSTPYTMSQVFSDAPTTEYLTIWERIRDNYIKKVQIAWKVRKFLAEQTKVLKSLNINLSVDAEDRYKHYVKVYNTAFGIQIGRPLGPLAEFIGPILQTKAPKLTNGLKHYLDLHKRVAYIAFGQLTKMKSTDVTLILTGLIEAYENKEIDGFIWAIRGQEKVFPKFIVSQSNTTYDISSSLKMSPEHNSDFLFPSWAPQMEILNHASTLFFITHGGSASLYESLYSGTRMVVYPFFVDQPFAAYTAERNGYGLRLTSTASQKEATDIIRRAATDPNNTLQKNTNRFQALIQIRSKNGIIRGADIVEEVLFVSKNGRVTYRKDIKENLSFFKANNLDVYAVLIVTISLVIYIVGRLLALIIRAILITLIKQSKTKTL